MNYQSERRKNISALLARQENGFSFDLGEFTRTNKREAVFCIA